MNTGSENSTPKRSHLIAVVLLVLLAIAALVIWQQNSDAVASLTQPRTAIMSTSTTNTTTTSESTPTLSGKLTPIFTPEAVQ